MTIFRILAAALTGLLLASLPLAAHAAQLLRFHSW